MDTIPDFHNSGWETSRRFINQPDIFGSPESYLDVLPTYYGRTAHDVLIEKTSKGFSRLLDLGGGGGIGAVGIRKRFSTEKLDISVIGSEADTLKPFKLSPRELDFREPSKDHLIENNINFHQIDFTKITPDDIARLGRFDVITAVYSVGWMEEAKYKLLQKIEGLLKPDGIAFVGPLQILKNISDSSWQTESAFTYLNRTYGTQIDMSNGGVAFQKDNNKIQFPNIFETQAINAASERVKLLS